MRSGRGDQRAADGRGRHGASALEAGGSRPPDRACRGLKYIRACRATLDTCVSATGRVSRSQKETWMVEEGGDGGYHVGKALEMRVGLGGGLSR